MRDKSPEEIQELKQELTNQGFEELTEPSDVDDLLSRSGMVMIVVNSVCSCAGKAIREGVLNALEDGLDVDHKGTVFAGVDDKATEEVRNRAPESEPSSPSIYLFHEGEKIAYIPRKYTIKVDYEPNKVEEKLKNTVDSMPRQKAG